MTTRHHALLSRDCDTLGEAAARAERETPVLLERLAGAGASRVVEVGCGAGTRAFGLARGGLEVLATDPDPEFIAAARAQRNLPPGMIIEGASLADLATRQQEPFAAALCLDHTLPHLMKGLSLAEALVALGRLLRSGGLLILQVVNPGIVEKRGLWAPPMRRWRAGETDVTLMRQWVDAGDSTRAVLTQITSGSGPAMGTSWDLRLPKVGASDLKSKLTRGGWKDIEARGSWDGSGFNPDTDEWLIVSATR